MNDEEKPSNLFEGIENRPTVSKDEKFTTIRGEIKATNDAINSQDTSRPIPSVIREKEELEERQIDLTGESNELVSEEQGIHNILDTLRAEKRFEDSRVVKSMKDHNGDNDGFKGYQESTKRQQILQRAIDRASEQLTSAKPAYPEDAPPERTV